MKNNELYQILRIIFIIIIAVLIIKLFIWALPILFLIVIGYLIYKNIINNKPKKNKETKRKTINKVVHEAEIVSEKND